MECDVDIPHHELLELAKAFVAQATPIVREQERLIDHLHDNPQDSRLVRRLLANHRYGFRCSGGARSDH